MDLPFHNNLADNYSILAWADGYEQAGFQPVKINLGTAQALDLMLLPKNGAYHFANAKWPDLVAKHPFFGGPLRGKYNR